MPELLRGRDLVLDLGVIDDSDVTYLNSHVVGKMGNLEGTASAWNSDRLYRLPAEHLTGGANLILVHVMDIWGLGGTMGRPVLGLCLVPKDVMWQFTPLTGSACREAVEASPTLAQLVIPRDR